MNVRTSTTDPIRVDWLPGDLANMPGRLGMTLAPGKHEPSRSGESWDRDLRTDLRRLERTYDVDCIVTLVEEVELRELGIEELFDEATDRGMEVYWYSVVDGEVPKSEEAVEALVDHVLSRVYSSERVVVHCRGGLGRAGTFVGCCLRSLEYEPERAVELVRDARPGAIENDRQGRYVREFDGFWLPFHFYASHNLYRVFEHIDDFQDPEPDEYPSEVISRSPDHEPMVRAFPPPPPPEDTSPDPNERTVFERAAEALSARAPELSPAELDRTIDRAMENEPFEAGPRVATAAFARFYERFDPYSLGYVTFRSRPAVPHVRNGARRLYLRATENEPVPGQEELRSNVRSALWADEPAARHVAHRDELTPVMSVCALRFDGYAYLERCGEADYDDGADHIRQITDEMEAGASLEDYSDLDKLAAFFHLQRWLGRGGSRSRETSPKRRVFRELFIDLHDLRVDRRWIPEASPQFYDEWRWVLRPVAGLYVELAEEELNAIDYEFSCENRTSF